MSKKEDSDTIIIKSLLAASIFICFSIANKDHKNEYHQQRTYELIDTKKFKTKNPDRENSIDWNDLETSEELFKHIIEKSKKEQKQKEKP
jgi:hypothetical protein